MYIIRMATMKSCPTYYIHILQHNYNFMGTFFANKEIYKRLVAAIQVPTTQDERNLNNHYDYYHTSHTNTGKSLKALLPDSEVISRSLREGCSADVTLPPWLNRTGCAKPPNRRSSCILLMLSLPSLSTLSVGMNMGGRTEM